MLWQGVGGVGSWAAEALARPAMGRLTLIDLDGIWPGVRPWTGSGARRCNGQPGCNKVRRDAGRVVDLGADGCAVTLVDDFVTPENVAA